MRQNVTLVFDIGKTVKKAYLFDRDFNVLDQRTETFRETADEDGYPCEDIDAVTRWTTEILREVAQADNYTLTHLNFSAYGASFIHLNTDRQIETPLYNYLKPFPDSLREKFLNTYNADGLLLRATASPMLGMLNSGLQLYWLRHQRPEVFERITTSLHLPQYFSFLATGKRLSEVTSVGCHTMMWDYGAMTYHKWVTMEGLIGNFPELHTADHRIEHIVHNRQVTTGIGVHDSSAALMPYLVTMREKFILLSTGTWNIAFNPFNHLPLSEDELQQDCLCYLTYDSKPVKASRIFLGHEHQAQVQLLQQHFGSTISPDALFDERLFTKMSGMREPGAAFHPLAMEGTGPNIPHPGAPTDLTVFNGIDEAYYQMVRHLVLWQKISLDLIDPLCEVKPVIVVGGFARNRIFLETLKREIPSRVFMVSDHPCASALGAAWLVHDRDQYSSGSNLLNITAF